jgi:hypothetical protein
VTVTDDHEIDQAREAVQRSLDWQDDSAREKSEQQAGDDS